MNPDPLVPNPFAVLGLPEWPDLDDETVHAAWQAIAAETHPDRRRRREPGPLHPGHRRLPELSSPWGRTEAFADLLERPGPRAATTPTPATTRPATTPATTCRCPRPVGDRARPGPAG